MTRIGRIKPLFSVCFMASVLAPIACQRSNKSSDSPEPPQNKPVLDCATDKTDQCAQVEATIADLQAKRQAAKDAKDPVVFSRTSIELSHQTELLDLLRRDESDPAVYADLESKYAELGRQFEADIASHVASPAPASGKPTTVVPPIKVDDGGRHEATLALSPLVYAPSELAAVTEVMKDLGDLYIDVSDATQSHAVEVPMPWSGYWYPMRGDDLYAKPESPLQKLDKVAAGRHLDAHAAQAEVDSHRGVSFESWEGLCAAWASASVKVPEPKHAAVVDGVSFSVADQKGLLTKSFEAFPNKVYGTRYHGDAETDGTWQDLRPEGFHRFVERYLGELHRPFLIDSDPGVEVWTKPVYRMAWTMKRDPSKPNAVIVIADPWMVSERDGIDDDINNVHEHETDRPTTIGEDKRSPPYQYRLYFDPHTMRDGKYRVIAGEWLEREHQNLHPDIISVPADNDDWLSQNPELNKEMEIVKQIIAAGQTP